MIGRGETIRFADLCQLCLFTVNGKDERTWDPDIILLIFSKKSCALQGQTSHCCKSLFYPDCCLWSVDRLVQVISFPTFDKPALAAIFLFATRGHWFPFKRMKKSKRGQEILLHMFNHKIHVQHIFEFVCVLWMRLYLKQPQWTCSPNSLEEFSMRIIMWYCFLFESVLISQSFF